MCMWILNIVVVATAMGIAQAKLESRAGLSQTNGGGKSAQAPAPAPPNFPECQKGPHGGYIPPSSNDSTHKYDVDQAQKDKDAEKTDPTLGPICIHRNELMQWKSKSTQLFDVSFLLKKDESSSGCDNAPVVQDAHGRPDTTTGCRPEYNVHLKNSKDGLECTYEVTINFGKPCGNGAKIDPHVRTY